MVGTDSPRDLRLRVMGATDSDAASSDECVIVSDRFISVVETTPLIRSPPVSEKKISSTSFSPPVIPLKADASSL
jgi:hypothetical protein